jgi:hypothetical protein
MSESANPSTIQTVDEVRYVAFCDILGFSGQLLTNFEKVLEAYTNFAETLSPFAVAEVNVTMYSDAILITGVALPKVLVAVQNLWFLALSRDLMIRGGIAKGRYWEQRRDAHLLVVSDALVRAVKLEREVRVPAVVLADDIEIPDAYWQQRFVHGPIYTALLHFRDRNIVNPFNPLWFTSAGVRARNLMEESPVHKDKYLWFLALHQAVASDQPLIPEDVFARFLRAGILKRTEPLH